MKKILLLLLVAGVFCGCKNEPEQKVYSGIYSEIPYNCSGYNADVKEIQDGFLNITLFGGEHSFEHIIFPFAETTYIDSINVQFSDTLSKPIENCRCAIYTYNIYTRPKIKNGNVVLDENGNIEMEEYYDNYHNLYDYINYNIDDLKNGKLLEIKDSIDFLELAFTSNSSEKSPREIKINKIDFNYSE